MATVRQVNANRENAQHSTGPVTSEGKNAARGNSIKHGLSGGGIVLNDADSQAVAERVDAWRGDFGSLDDHQEWLYRRMIVASVRLDRCSREQFALRSYESDRARLAWDADRERDAAETGKGMTRNPTLVVRRLSCTKQGCEWMIREWQELDMAYKVNLEWDEPRTSRALDLLGTSPTVRGCVLFEDTEQVADIIKCRIDALESQIKSGLSELDALERKHAQAGDPLTPSRDVLRLRRYEADLLREYYRARADLLGSLPSPTVATPTQPQSQPDPAPEPVAISAMSPAPPSSDMKLMGHDLTELVMPVEPAEEIAQPTAAAPQFQPSVGTPSHRHNRRQRRAAKKRARSH